MFSKKTYFVGSRFPGVAKRNDLAINTTTGTINYRGPNGWVSVGGSGGPGGDLTVPTSIKDTNGDDLITFSRTDTGTARIGTPQDDLSLRSARDITLFAGDDGPGNVYIGWGDATYTPDSPNRVATIADIQDANTGGITFVDNTISSDNGDDIIIENKNDSGDVKARIRLDQSNEQVLIEAIKINDDWFNDTQWDTAVWSGAVVTITNTPDIINFFDTIPGNVTRVSINNGSSIAYEGASYGDGSIAINVDGSPFAEQDPLTITEIRFYYSVISKINMDHDDNEFEIISNGMSMTIDSSGDLDLIARDEDVNIFASDDIDFVSNWDNNTPSHEWRMTNTGRFELPGDGYIENVRDSSSDNGSSDTIKIVPDSNLLENNILNADQYIILDPTSPNHIHIRSGGTIDASTADLIVGGERNKVMVSDGYRSVGITTRPTRIENSYQNLNTESSTQFAVTYGADIQNNYTVNVGGTDYLVDSVNSIDEGVIGVTANGAVFEAGTSYTFIYEKPWDNSWSFNSDGILSGPVNQYVTVSGLNITNNRNLYLGGEDMGGYFAAPVRLASGNEMGTNIPFFEFVSTGAATFQSVNSDIILQTPNGESYITSVDPDNKIATLGDLPSGVTGSFNTATHTITVTNGIITAIDAL
jgi:hypothetical protein